MYGQNKNERRPAWREQCDAWVDNRLEIREGTAIPFQTLYNTFLTENPGYYIDRAMFGRIINSRFDKEKFRQMSQGIRVYMYKDIAFKAERGDRFNDFAHPSITPDLHYTYPLPLPDPHHSYTPPQRWEPPLHIPSIRMGTDLSAQGLYDETHIENETTQLHPVTFYQFTDGNKALLGSKPRYSSSPSIIGESSQQTKLEDLSVKYTKSHKNNFAHSGEQENSMLKDGPTQNTFFPSLPVAKCKDMSVAEYLNAELKDVAEDSTSSLRRSNQM